MIVLISGGLGTGKTCMLTKYAVTSHKEFNKEVISNYKLNHVPFKKLDIVDIYLNHPELKNIFIAGDELYTFMDCRCSGTKRNRLESYFIAQSRKKNVDLFFTSQYSGFVDKRLITFVNIWVRMKNVWLYDKKTGIKYKHPYLFLVEMLDLRTDDMEIKYFRFDGRKWFNQYNTNEGIYPPNDYLNSNKEMVNKRKAN